MYINYIEMKVGMSQAGQQPLITTLERDGEVGRVDKFSLL